MTLCTRCHGAPWRGPCGRGYPPYPRAAPRYCQKSAKSASPRFAGHAPQPMPGRFPHAPDPHTGHVLMQPRSDYAPAETSVRFTQIHASNRSTQIPSNDRSTQMRIRPTYSNSLRRRGGHGMAPLRDAATASTGGPASKPARRRAPAAQGVDPRGIWTGWTRQKSAGAAPDRAGRMADHAGQARRHAGAWVRSLHFPTLLRIS